MHFVDTDTSLTSSFSGSGVPASFGVSDVPIYPPAPPVSGVQ